MVRGYVLGAIDYEKTRLEPATTGPAMKTVLAMSQQLNQWHRRIHFSKVAKASLGFGFEYWDLNPEHYEGYEELRNRRAASGFKSTRRELVYDLASHLLVDLIVAAGGVEHAITKLREALAVLNASSRKHPIASYNGVLHLSDEHSVTAWYAFSEVLSWSRTVVERLERSPRDRKKFPKQGLIPALKPKRLKKRCQKLFNELQKGPVGQARPLANFVLHGALVQDPFSGVQVRTDGTIVLPIPDSRPASHWYLLMWDEERNGFVFAEEIWQAIQEFIDQLLGSFERSVPKRLRR